jgi:hypothetical protein
MKLGFNPWVLLGAGVLALALLTGGYAKGHSDAAASYKLTIAAMQRQAQTLKDAEAAKANSAATVLETQNAEAKVIYRTITKTADRVVERPVYRNACFDDAGLQLANAALAGAAVDTGQPDSAVPDARPAQ